MGISRHFDGGYWKLLRLIQQAGGAPCEDSPDLFFPDDFTDPAVRAAASKTAKALCRSCPVVTDCFEYAVSSNQRHGIWGATSPSER
jgi:WhiB family redox-sensing transcriptional regulator